MSGRHDDAPRRVRVGLLGMYASVNLGDTAIQTSVMQALRARRPGVEFLAICTAPEDAVATFGIPARDVSGFGAELRPGAAAWRSGLAERGPLPVRLASAALNIRRHMQDLDMLLVSGSGQIDDYWGGPWEQPFRLLAWASAARAQGKPVAFFGVGVDQLMTRAGTWLALRAMGKAQLRVLRDPGSLQALDRLGFRAACDVCPDPAFALDISAARAGGAYVGRPFAVVSPIARKAWPGPHDEAYDAYLATLAAAVDHLQARGLEVRFVCSQTRMDPPVVAIVQAGMRSAPEATRVDTPVTVDDYLRLVNGAQLVLGSRLHALILALTIGTPVIAVSYARKVSQQMQDAGLGQFCFDLPTLDRAALLRCIDTLLDRQPQVQADAVRTAQRFRSELEARFDRLAALVAA
jgi:polysaccharide pyruvyl transferase WcaK-like protein